MFNDGQSYNFGVPHQNSYNFIEVFESLEQVVLKYCSEFMLNWCQ